MRVGYVIRGLNSASQRDEFLRFLKDTLILEEGYASNIADVVANGDRVNIYTQRELSETLSGNGSYAFKATFGGIDVPRGSYLIASAVDFRVEIMLNGTIKALAPTEYFMATREVALSFIREIKQGLLRIFPDVTQGEEADKWILSDGEWDDSGVWVDEQDWRDA